MGRKTKTWNLGWNAYLENQLSNLVLGSFLFTLVMVHRNLLNYIQFEAIHKQKHYKDFGLL